MKRRQFCKYGSLGFLGTLFPFYGQNLFARSQQSYSPIVWEVEGDASTMVRVLIKEIGGLAALTDKDISKTTVLIKPNLCLPHRQEMGTTTSPQLVAAFCEYFTNAGVAKIILIDHTLQGDIKKFHNSQIVKITEAYPKSRWIFANEQRFYKPLAVKGNVLEETEILKILQRADITINLATAKHHSATQVSLCVKNLMGCIWDRSSFHTEMNLHQAIGDLAQVIRPTLNVVDATRVLLNGGPTGPGMVVKDNRIFASYDPLTVDSIILSRYDFGGRQMSAKEVPHLMAAFQYGIGEIDINKIQVRKISA